MTKEKEAYQPHIENTYGELKDFQRATVDYVYQKFYVENADRFLVADEVGLGKTIVAKGLIAKAFEAFVPSKENPTFNVIYICSNQALARENLRKLNFTQDENAVEDPLNRLIYLAFKSDNDRALLRFDALTPATSLTISNRSGSVYERVIIYTLLAHYAPFEKRKNGLKWLLRGNVGIERWQREIKIYRANRREWFRPETYARFRAVLNETMVSEEYLASVYEHLRKQKPVSFWQAILDLCDEVGHQNAHKMDFKNEVIVCLRQLLTKVCLEYLSADLIILDEFQRYAELLSAAQDDDSSPAAELVRSVFSLKNTKVLLLSATPFKPFTVTAEEERGESHFAEFQRVLKFLLPTKGPEFWTDLERNRREYFAHMMAPRATLDHMAPAIELKEQIQDTFKQAIVRTERNRVSANENALIHSVLDRPMEVSVHDVVDFISLDAVARVVQKRGHGRSESFVEYSKSCPYPLSFLDGYQLRSNLEELKDDKEVAARLAQETSAWLSLRDIEAYRPLGGEGEQSRVPNAKMQWLLNSIHQSGSWRWLWVPPTITYYAPPDIYPATTRFSKTLVFSSWRMVPRAIATITSYEAERLALKAYANTAGAETPESYFADADGSKRRKPQPLLTFRISSATGSSSAMTLFTLVYPSRYLVELFDPEENLSKQESIDVVLRDLATRIEEKFLALDLGKYAAAGGASERWYWAAPLLLDKFVYTNSLPMGDLLEDLLEEDAAQGDGESRNEEIAGRNRKKHIRDLLRAYKRPESAGLGTVPTDLFKVLALMCVASPAVCFARSSAKSLGVEFTEAFRVAFSFGIAKLHFFNKPEHIAIVKSTTSSTADSYWMSVLNYCLCGNIQSSLDEYLHLLKESGNSFKDIGELLVDVLALRTSGIRVDDATSFASEQSRRLRAHYAVDFGTQDLETDSGTGRLINVRQAFNSPYRPFVLASTSIGQEGLDFHFYCGEVMHWNLPNNAIDIEQREGRVNRYKGLVIRRNVAAKYLQGSSSTDPSLPVWDRLFKIALREEGTAEGRCELVPFWHVEPLDGINIRRVVPLYPFSRDIEKYRALIETLTLYRLTLGQPRQEELVETLQRSGLTTDEINLLKQNLLIDLSPLQWTSPPSQESPGT